MACGHGARASRPTGVAGNHHASRAWKGETRRAAQSCWRSPLEARRPFLFFYGGLFVRAAVITVSDKGYSGEREDRSGPVLADALSDMGADVVERRIVPDAPEQIRAVLAELADRGDIDVITTTGGTGIAPRDRTPEATRAVIDYEVPGIAEALRFEGFRKTPLAVISRGVAGVRGRCLIVNLPGSAKAVAEGMETLRAILPHAVKMVRGEDLEHGEHRHG